MSFKYLESCTRVKSRDAWSLTVCLQVLHFCIDAITTNTYKFVIHRNSILILLLYHFKSFYKVKLIKSSIVNMFTRATGEIMNFVIICMKEPKYFTHMVQEVNILIIHYTEKLEFVKLLFYFACIHMI